MDKLIIKVLSLIDRNNLIEKGQTVLLAVSGGYDSMCMLYLLDEIKKIRGFDIKVMHLNHSFREQADCDFQFVKSVSEKLGLEFFGKKVDVMQYAKEKNISFETAGREVRYQFFNEVALRFPNSVIATAHNANDNVESFFMHLMRGSGLNGLCGIAVKRDNIIRPIIELTRQEIEEYCDKNGIVPVIDITNESDDYTRNDIRHNVIPEVLKRCSIDSLIRTMDIIYEDNKFCENYVKTVAKNCIIQYNGYSKIKIKQFNLLEKSVKRRILYDFLKQDTMASVVHIDSIIDIASKNRGGSEVELPGGKAIRLNKGMLEIYER